MDAWWEDAPGIAVCNREWREIGEVETIVGGRVWRWRESFGRLRKVWKIWFIGFFLVFYWFSEALGWTGVGWLLQMTFFTG